MKTIVFIVTFLFSAHAQSLEAVLQNAVPELLAGNVPSIAAALAATPSLSPLLAQTQPMPAMPPSAVNGTVAIPPAMVPIISPTNASQTMMPSVPVTEVNASQLLAPIVAPAVVAFAQAPATGAPLTATAVLAPGTVAIITPPSFSNASLPGELPPSPMLSSAVRPYLAQFPGYSVHLVNSSAFLPNLPAPLQYQSVQGAIVAVLNSNASANATSQVPFQATVLGISPVYSALASSPALSPVPANFTPPTLPGLNVTYYALAAGAPVPAVSGMFEFAQLAPGVLAIITQQDQQYLTGPPVTAASPATPQGSASTAQSLISSLTPAEIAAFPSVPQGLQIILLPTNLSLAGLPDAMAIPASFTVPQQLQSYNYILTSASDAIPALPAGFNSTSPSPGITIIYAEQAAASPAPAPAGPPAASVLALPMTAVMNGPFVLNAGAPVASNFQAPSYLQGFRVSELPANSLLPTVPTGFSVLPIYPGLTAIVQANSTLLPGSAPAPAPAGSSVAASDFPPALLNNMPNFDTAPGLLVTGVPMTANATQILASINSTRYMGLTIALPPNETYFMQPVQAALAEMFPGYEIGGILGSILALAA